MSRRAEFIILGFYSLCSLAFWAESSFYFSKCAGSFYQLLWIEFRDFRLFLGKLSIHCLKYWAMGPEVQFHQSIWSILMSHFYIWWFKSVLLTVELFDSLYSYSSYFSIIPGSRSGAFPPHLAHLGKRTALKLLLFLLMSHWALLHLGRPFWIFPHWHFKLIVGFSI